MPVQQTVVALCPRFGRIRPMGRDWKTFHLGSKTRQTPDRFERLTGSKVRKVNSGDRHKLSGIPERKAHLDAVSSVQREHFVLRTEREAQFRLFYMDLHCI